MEAIQYSDRYFKLIGKLLINQSPGMVNRLLSPYFKETPCEQDLSKIKGYYYLFCAINDINEDATVQQRRLFIASMIRIYNPQVHDQPTHQISLRHRLVRCISEALKQKESNVSTMIREVICWERSYEEFAQEVSVMIQKLTNAGKEEK